MSDKYIDKLKPNKRSPFPDAFVKMYAPKILEDGDELDACAFGTLYCDGSPQTIARYSHPIVNIELISSAKASRSGMQCGLCIS